MCDWHTHKSFLKHVESNKMWIFIILFCLIWLQTKFRLLSHQSEQCNYNPNLVWLNKIQKTFLYVYDGGMKRKGYGFNVRFGNIFERFQSIYVWKNSVFTYEKFIKSSQRLKVQYITTVNKTKYIKIL